jgi:amino acid adenylation domain-containing protein
MRTQRLLERLRIVTSEQSGYDVKDVIETQTFLELGFDSLFLTQLAEAFRNEYGLKITFRQLFDELPTIRSLADYIDKHLPPEALVPATAAPGATNAPIAAISGDSVAASVRSLPKSVAGIEISVLPALGEALFLAPAVVASRGGLQAVMAQQLALTSLLHLLRSLKGADVSTAVPLGSAAALASGVTAAASPAAETTARGPIVPAPSQAVSGVAVPLSEAQREIWAAVQMGSEASCAFNLCFALRLVGAVSVEALRLSIQHLFDRHEALRMTFDPFGEWQVPQPPHLVDLPLVDLSGLPPMQRVAALDAIFIEEVETPLNLVSGPPARVRIVVEAPDQCLLVLTAHHVVFDGWSAWIFFQELAALYGAARRGKIVTLQPAVPFSRFVRREGQAEGREAAKRAQSYWKARFEDSVPILDLPLDRPRPAVKTYRGAMETLRLDAALSASIKRAAGQQGSTIVGFLFAAYQALLQRLSGQSDVVIGLAVSVRDVADRKTLVGHVTNLLPIRIQSEDRASFTMHLRAVKTAILDALEHQALTFGTLARCLNLPWDPSRTPLVAATFNLDRVRISPEFVDAEAAIFMPPRRHLNFELEMNFADTGREFIVECSYNPDLLTDDTIRRWLGHYAKLLAGAVADSESPLNRLPLLTDAEQHQLRVEWNDTVVDFPVNLLLHELFEAQVERTPQRTALRVGATTLSYAALNTRAARMAQALRSRGVIRGQRVGLCIERGADMLAAVLGILKAGAAYVPLDPSFPADRLRFMADDAQLAVLVSTTALAGSFGLPRERQLLLDADAKFVASAPDTRLPIDAYTAQPGDPAYVIYTSGSTGKPKGVVVPHRAVVNFLTSMAREPGLTADDVLVAVTTLSFDIAVLELQLPLTLGATVVIASRDEAIDGHALSALLEQHGATVMQATPVTWRLLLEAGWAGRTSFKALVGGEALPKDLADQLIARGVELWNLYGPTETTVWSTCARITDTSNGITIGKPIANTTVWILDAQKNLCPIGVHGELCIGGNGVTLGYWNRLELTADRFIPDPFSTTPGATLYRTGDRARRRNDGMLEHLGRLDDQVKVRGFRIELGEIEAILAEHPDVRQAAVHLWTVKANDVRIIACCVPAKAGVLAPISLRKHLRARLPEYMVPQDFLPVDEIPLTPNGKVDRRRLPTPVVTESRIGRHEAPSDAIEATIADIWTNLIHPARPIGRFDKLFEIGGHSLLGVQALRQIEHKLGVSLDFRVLVQESLAEIATRCRSERIV